jgi:hypothetical protein
VEVSGTIFGVRSVSVIYRVSFYASAFSTLQLIAMLAISRQTCECNPFVPMYPCKPTHVLRLAYLHSRHTYSTLSPHLKHRFSST